MDLIKFLGLMAWLRIAARIPGRKGCIVTAEETELERALYSLLGPGD